MDSPLRVFRADDPLPMPASGFARTPKWILARRDLRSRAKAILGAIIGSCFGESRTCDTTVAILAERAGLSIATAVRAIDELEAAGLVCRGRDDSRPGKPWFTKLLFDPSAPKPHVDSNDMPPINLIGEPLRLIGEPLRLIGGTVLYSPARKQELLNFDKKTTTEKEQSSSSFQSAPAPCDPTPLPVPDEIPSQAAKLFPEVKADMTRLDREIAAHGIEKVALGLELAQILSRKEKTRPRIFQWLPGTLRNWRDRTIESIRAEIEAVRGPKISPLDFSRPTPEPTAEAKPPGVIGEWWKALREGRTDDAIAVLDSLPPDQEKPVAESLGKEPPRPAKGIDQAEGLDVAAPLSGATNGAEGDRTLNLRIANAAATEPSGIHAKTPSEGGKNADQVAVERRIRNAALSPSIPDPLDYKLDFSRDHHHLSTPGEET